MPINRGESIVAIWPPMAGRRIRNQFIISYPELFEEEIGRPGRYLLVYVEPLELTESSSPGYIKLIIKSIIESYNNRPKGGKGVPLSQTEFLRNSSDDYPKLLETLRELIKEIAANNLEIILFLGEFDELEFADSILYNNLKSLWVRSEGKLHFVFLLLEDVTGPELLKKFGELNELLLRNVVWVSLLDKEDVDYLIEYFSKQLNRSFSGEEKDLLAKLCGGHPYLIKSCSRLIALLNGEKLEISKLREILISHFEPRSVCQKIFDRQSPAEQDILRQLANGKVSQLPEAADTLIKLGLIRKNKDGVWLPFGEIFQAVIKNKKHQAATPANGGLSFLEKSGAILIGNTNVEEKFTRQEYEILRFFLKEPDKLRSRDEIGEAMWGKESYDKYSDWAIDQVLSKIRKKLNDLGAGNSLATVRGRGYKLTLV